MAQAKQRTIHTMNLGFLHIIYYKVWCFHMHKVSFVLQYMCFEVHEDQLAVLTVDYILNVLLENTVSKHKLEAKAASANISIQYCTKQTGCSKNDR